MKLSKNNIFRSLNKVKKIWSSVFFILHKFGREKRVPSHLEVNRNLVYSLSTKKIPNPEQLKQVGRFLSSREKLAIKICGAILLGNLIYLGFIFFQNHLVSSPRIGGQYFEGVVGVPKYINPLYSSSRDVDSDLSRLIYSSLLQFDRQGNLVGDLATSWQADSSSKEFTLVLRDGAKWHSGETVTVDDVIFTFKAIQDPKYHSPLRNSFSGIDIQKLDDKTIKFVLPQPYAAFPELLTFGILPKNIWELVSPDSATLAELNLKPVGSGPYKFQTLTKNKTGEIKEYTLAANLDYYGKRPYINQITFRFFSDSNSLLKALNDDNVDGIAYLPFAMRKDLLAKSSRQFHLLNIPQINAIFFNAKNNDILGDKVIRQALDAAINKEKIVKETLGGQAHRAYGPIPEDSPFFNMTIKKDNFSTESAEKLLNDAGYEKIAVPDEALLVPTSTISGIPVQTFIDKANEEGVTASGFWRVKKIGKKGTDFKFLTINLSYSDSPDNSLVAEEVKKSWENIGIKTVLNPVAPAQAGADISRTKNFEAFLYGEIVGFNPDVYAFWHSSQIENGFNLSSYSNPTADKLLEEARVSSDNGLRAADYQKFQELVNADTPAIFLYSPFYLYIQTKKLRGFETVSLLEPQGRFTNVSEWYLRVKRRLSW